MSKRWALAALLLCSIVAGGATVLGLQRPALADVKSFGIFGVQAGGGTDALIDLGTTGNIEDLVFQFGGSPDVRVHIVRSLDSVLHITFADHTPAEASAFFRDNPQAYDSSVWVIELRNPSDRDAQVHVTARWK